MPPPGTLQAGSLPLCPSPFFGRHPLCRYQRAVTDDRPYALIATTFNSRLPRRGPRYRACLGTGVVTFR
jgi:hypothetical protein